MTIEFLGAARTVTGSMHLVHVNGAHILLDCGLFQGRRAESKERSRHFPFDAQAIDAVILSHAHIDHSGNLPNLVKQGFAGPIFCTHATRDLCGIMLKDSAYIQERDAEFLNKKNRRNNEPPVEPIYTVQDADEAIEKLKGVDYNSEFTVLHNVTATLADAGHILGSAGVRLTVRQNGTVKHLGFTGDIGRWGMPIIRDPAFIGNVEALISESTYGGVRHDSPQDVPRQLREVLVRTVGRGGKVIVPAFSVGRTQDIIHALFQLFQDGTLPRIPIYVDSPLAVNATEIFRQHPECFDAETYGYIRNDEDPFGMNQVRYVQAADESKELNDRSESCMIISASGMCEAGRILHHLANNIEDSRNTILIVGYQAEHTLGRRLVEKEDEVKILGGVYKRRAEVVVHNSFSAHADGAELLRYMERFEKKQLQRIFLVHGEEERAEAFRSDLSQSGFNGVEIPVRGQKEEL